jgi:hypothetical protein
LSALKPADLGSKAFMDSLSVGSGEPGLIFIACGLSLMVFGARIFFVALGLTIGAGAFVTRGSTFVMAFFGAGFTLCTIGLMARATGFCEIGFEARAT